MKKLALLSVIALLCAGTTTAQDKGELSALLFGDYFWMASNHDEDLEGKNGFWIRRIYLTYDRGLSDSFSARIRLEMSSEGDFVTSAKLDPVVKDAYLEWESGDHAILAGISGTPTFNISEDVWGYRSVEKAPLDLHDFGSSRDFGIAAEGKLGANGNLQYNLMFGNGNSNSSEVDKGKKWMLSLAYNLNQNFVIEAYADWNDQTGDTDYYTLKGFAGYQSDSFNAGFVYAHQKRDNFFDEADQMTDLELDIISAFTNFSISEKTTGLLRVDHMFEPNPDMVDNDYLPFSTESESTLIITGIDIAVDDHVHLIPNIETIVYGENKVGDTPATDILPKMTLFFTF